jgi:NAD+ synthase
MLVDEAGNTATDYIGREKTVFEIYKRLNTNNKHKMEEIPVCMIPKTLK